jgi:hypothetical protein
MAPIQVESIQQAPTTFEPVQNVPIRSNKTEYGNYKEFFTGREVYSKEEAEKGAEGQPAAKYANYLPTWNPDEKYGPSSALKAHSKYCFLIGLNSH